MKKLFYILHLIGIIAVLALLIICATFFVEVSSTHWALIILLSCYLGQNFWRYIISKKSLSSVRDSYKTITADLPSASSSVEQSIDPENNTLQIFSEKPDRSNELSIVRIVVRIAIWGIIAFTFGPLIILLLWTFYMDITGQHVRWN